MKRSLSVLSASILLMLAGGTTAGWLASRAIGQAARAVPAATISYGNLQGIGVLAPGGDPAGLVVLLSDRGGISQADRDLAADLVADDLIVLPVDLDRWRTALEAAAGPDAECLYLGSDLEGVAKEALRTLDLDTYFHPTVVGREGCMQAAMWEAIQDL